MTTHPRAVEAIAASVAKQTAIQRLLAAAAWLDGRTSDGRYATLHDVEKMELAALRATPVKGTVFAVLHLAIAEGSLDGSIKGLQIPGTVGGVMDAFGLDQTQTDRIACWCDNGNGIDSGHLATNLRNIAAEKNRVT